VIAIQKPLSGLQKVLQEPHKLFHYFGSGFTELQAKLDAGTLLNLSSMAEKTKRSRKCTRVKTINVHSAVSRGRPMQ
jgi:hypothetical protein